MKNITISMEDNLYRRTRIGAAKAGQSMSRYLSEAAKTRLDADEGVPSMSGRNAQLEAIERFLAGPALNIAEDGRMPSTEERNSRDWQRDIR